MHRSGTSMLTRLLNISGVYLGENHELVGAAESNIKGHWENKKIKDINDEILNILGGASYNPPNLPQKWYLNKDLDSITIKAQQYLNNAFSKKAVWGWKDPRTCLTFPFWENILETEEIKIVIIIRNSLAVAQSLKKRGNNPIEYGLWLWSKYWTKIIQNTKNHSTLFITYEDLLNDWRQEMTRIFEFLDSDKLTLDDKEDQIKNFIDPTLRHNKGNINNTQSINTNDKKDVIIGITKEMDYINQYLYSALGKSKYQIIQIKKEINQLKESKSTSFYKTLKEKIMHIKETLT
jgi:hypothetical protein